MLFRKWIFQIRKILQLVHLNVTFFHTRLLYQSRLHLTRLVHMIYQLHQPVTLTHHQLSQCAAVRQLFTRSLLLLPYCVVSYSYTYSISRSIVSHFYIPQFCHRSTAAPQHRGTAAPPYVEWVVIHALILRSIVSHFYITQLRHSCTEAFLHHRTLMMMKTVS